MSKRSHPDGIWHEMDPCSSRTVEWRNGVRTVLDNGTARRMQAVERGGDPRRGRPNLPTPLPAPAPGASTGVLGRLRRLGVVK